jgi:hypothetical protein
LIQNEEVRKDLGRILPVGGKVYMVVAIMICKDAKVELVGQRANKSNTSVTAPIGKAVQAAVTATTGAPVVAGLATLGDFELECATSKAADWSMKGTANGGQIFAIEYRIVRRRHLGFGKEPVLSDEKVQFEEGLTYGGSDAEDSDDEEMINTADVSFETEGLNPGNMGMVNSMTGRYDKENGWLYLE